MIMFCTGWTKSEKNRIDYAFLFDDFFGYSDIRRTFELVKACRSFLIVIDVLHENYNKYKFEKYIFFSLYWDQFRLLSIKIQYSLNRNIFKVLTG